MKNADLHTHSLYSDGVLTPEQLVKRAKEKGLKYLALTDHNSMKGNKEAIEAGKKFGVEVIPGIEASSEWGEVLGYFVDSGAEDLLELAEASQKNVQDNARKCIKEMRKLGFDVSFEKVKEEYPKYPMMCFYVSLYLEKQGSLEKASDLYKDYINKKFKIEYKMPKMEKVIKAIKKAGGVAILSHPFHECELDKVIEKLSILVDIGLDGFEIDNGQHEYDIKIRKQLMSLAKKYNLILTAGSDFHGEYVKSDVGDDACDEKVVEQIKERAKIK